MASYIIPLKNEKTGYYNNIALLLILLNLAFFIYLSIASGEKGWRIAAILGSVLVSVCLLIDVFLGRIRNNEGFMYRDIAFAVIGFTWWQLGFWIPGIIILVLGLLYQAAKRPLIARFSHEKIVYTSFVPLKITWSQCANAVLKDGLLTIDLKNNRIIQQQVDETKTRITETEFNDFCRAQLRATFS